MYVFIILEACAPFLSLCSYSTLYRLKDDIIKNGRSKTKDSFLTFATKNPQLLAMLQAGSPPAPIAKPAVGSNMSDEEEVPGKKTKGGKQGDSNDESGDLHKFILV
jgi:hypothetical protein